MGMLKNDKGHCEYDTFVSYALKDERFAKWLQIIMESFRLPIDIRELPEDERPVLWDFRTSDRSKAVSSEAAYLQVPEVSLLKDNKKSKILRRIGWYMLVSILILTGCLIWEYNRVRYEYYVSYVDCWGIPKGVDPLTAEQASACSYFYRFEYAHKPISEGNPFEWRLESVSCRNGYGQLQIPNAGPFFLKELECSICKLDYSHGKIHSLRFYDARKQLYSTFILHDYEGQPLSWIDHRYHEGSSGNMMEDGTKYLAFFAQFPYIKVDRDKDGYMQRISFHANNDRDIRNSAVCDEFRSFGYDCCYDKNHRLVKMVSLSKDMKPNGNIQGVVSVNFTYDEIGRVTGILYKDKSDCFIDGLPQVRNQYDEKGNLIEVRYFDKDGAPCLIYEKGISVEKYAWDEHGAMKECCYYDQALNPMNSKQGFAKVCYLRDAHGNALTRSYYGEDGNLTLITDGYAIENFMYNEENRIIERTFYGVDEMPILNNGGYACVRFMYDDQERIISESYYDETNIPIEADKVHGARVEYEFNADGLLASASYYDANGQPYVGQHGTKVVYKYDSRANIIEKTFYDEQGNLYVGVDRAARFRYWYDVSGMQTEARCYGSDGELTMHRQNFAILYASVDSLNRLLYNSFFDKEGKPSKYNLRQSALIKQIFEIEDSQSVIILSYNWDGNNYIERTRNRNLTDIHGNTISIQYLGPQGQRILNNDGVSSWTAKYDQRGNRIECNYFDIDDNPTNIKGYNFASWKASYDHKDRRIEQSYYDIHGNLTVSNRGVARWKAVYKDDENTPYMYYYDLDGNIISNDEE